MTIIFNHWHGVLLLLISTRLLVAIELNLSSIESIKSVGSTLAFDMMSFYKGNLTGGTPGELPYPGYYWWEAGGMWGCLIDYWYYTNDSTYNDVVEQGLLFQTGPDWDYMTPNQTMGMGNDDQGFWGMATMTAAEMNFQNPPASGPQWLSLTQAVFNEQVLRYEQEQQPASCGGGLRWQVYFFNDGWTYKNSISNACFFNLAARLAKYTGNDTYATWAETTWDWITEVGLMQLQPYNNASRNFSINGQGAGGYIVWDGATIESNCTAINGIPYTYNNGIFLLGAATMYNYTNGSEIWANRTQLLLNATLNAFFQNGVAVELSCEANMSCDVDMLSFKAYLARSLAATTQMAAFTKEQIMPALAASARAAAMQCSGGANGRMCGLSWKKGSTWDGSQGAGQQMAAMEIVLSNMIDFVRPPVTSTSGGTSVGNPSAGIKAAPSPDPILLWAPSVRDKAGATLLTMVVILGMMSLFVFMCLPEGRPAEQT